MENVYSSNFFNPSPGTNNSLKFNNKNDAPTEITTKE